MCNPSETKQENTVLLVPNELQENSEQFHKKLWSCIFIECSWINRRDMWTDQWDTQKHAFSLEFFLK